MRSVLLAILAFALVTAGACTDSITGPSSTPSDLQGTKVVIGASWAAETALNMKALGSTAARVVSGVVESVSPPKVATLSEGYEAGSKVVYSDAIVRLERALKGNAVDKNESISVRLLGGTFDGYTFVYEDEAQLTKGDHVVLFLTNSPNPYYPRDNGFQYAVLWGMHGAFRMQGDLGTRSAEIPADQRDKTLTEIEESVR